ncbi:MAG: hypothetical protein RLZ54_280 [Candidatus Parcubacteria bacterium]
MIMMSLFFSIFLCFDTEHMFISLEPKLDFEHNSMPSIRYIEHEAIRIQWFYDKIITEFIIHDIEILKASEYIKHQACIIIRIEFEWEMIAMSKIKLSYYRCICIITSNSFCIRNNLKIIEARIKLRLQNGIRLIIAIQTIEKFALMVV